MLLLLWVPKLSCLLAFIPRSSDVDYLCSHYHRHNRKGLFDDLLHMEDVVGWGFVWR